MSDLFVDGWGFFNLVWGGWQIQLRFSCWFFLPSSLFNNAPAGALRKGGGGFQAVFVKICHSNELSGSRIGSAGESPTYHAGQTDCSPDKTPKSSGIGTENGFSRLLGEAWGGGPNVTVDSGNFVAIIAEICTPISVI